jgi:histone deacetylase 1/2
MTSYGFHITRGSSFALHGFIDANWANSIDSRKSTGGYLVFFGQTPISWKFGKQRTVVGSSTEVEYKALTDGTAKVIWLQYLLIDLQVPSVSAPTIWCDNLGATYLSANPIFHAPTKHVEVDYHFIHDQVPKKKFRFLLSPLRINLQVFTKLLSAASFTTFHYKFHVDPPPSA